MPADSDRVTDAERLALLKAFDYPDPAAALRELHKGHLTLLDHVVRKWRGRLTPDQGREKDGDA